MALWTEVLSGNPYVREGSVRLASMFRSAPFHTESIYFSFTKKYLNGRSIVLSLSHQLEFLVAAVALVPWCPSNKWNWTVFKVSITIEGNTQKLSIFFIQIGLHQPLVGITNPKYKLSHFLTTKYFLRRDEGTSF